MSNLDYEAWRCEKHGNSLCPEDGCSEADGCARDKGWNLAVSVNYPDALKHLASLPAPEVDQDRLYSTTDAQVWAEEFAKVRPDVDRGLMIGWFANAFGTAELLALKRQSSAVDPHF